MLFQWKACCVLHGYIPLLWWFWHSDFPINNHPLLGQVADFNYFHLCRCLIPFLKFNTHILVVPLFYIFVFHAGIDFIPMIIHIIFNPILLWWVHLITLYAIFFCLFLFCHPKILSLMFSSQIERIPPLVKFCWFVFVLWEIWHLWDSIICS